MKIRDIFEQKEVVVSFEIFPPKSTTPVETIYKTIEELSELQPDYISVTYGAGGNGGQSRTVELASMIKNTYHTEALAHLTCITSTPQEVTSTLDQLKAAGIENILALRGDLPTENNGVEVLPHFQFASELVSHIKDYGHFCVAGACYPEKHQEAESFEQDIKNLKKKVENGAEVLVSQLFFDNRYFYDFLVEADQRGITVPIQAGIMPVTNKKQIERIVSLCGATVPSKFKRIMDRYEHNPEALRDAGIAYSIEQIIDLLSSGCRGIHLYTMNQPYIARKIMDGIGSVVKTINQG